MDSFPPEEIAHEMAHINENQGPLLITLCCVFTGVATIFFLLRMASLRKLHTNPAPDDWFALVALVFLIGLTIPACMLGGYGIGRHIIWVAKNHPEWFDKIRILEIAFSFLYVFSLCFSKMSVLALYSRMFSQSGKWVRWSIWFWMGYTIIWVIAVQIAMGTATHIKTAFTIPDAMTLAVGITNAIGDIGVLLIPQPVIWKLQRDLRTKLFISGVFFLGIFAVLIGIVRLPLLEGLPGQSPYDVTYHGFLSILFSVVEPAVVLMCCCAPAAAALFRSQKPKINSNYASATGRGYLRTGTPPGTTTSSRVVNIFKSHPGNETESVEAFDLSPTVYSGEQRRY